MSELVADHPVRTDASQSFNWVMRTKVQSLVNDRYYAAKNAANDRLDALFEDHKEKGFLGSGLTVRNGIEVFEEEATGLVASLVRDVVQFSSEPRAFALIAEATEQFLIFLDTRIKSVSRMVQAEIYDNRQACRFSESVNLLWSERRTRILEMLEAHRSRYDSPESANPETEVETIDRPESSGHAIQVGEAEICQRCCHWDPFHQDTASNVGLCRRFSIGPTSDAWPLTETSDSCKEWAEIGSAPASAQPSMPDAGGRLEPQCQDTPARPSDFTARFVRPTSQTVTFDVPGKVIRD